MLEVLTPLNKCIRTTRKVDSSNFVAAPGIWAEVDATGGLANITTASAPEVAKLVIGNASTNVYESHDVEVGRITSLEGPAGIRVKVSSDFYTGTIAQGDELFVSAVSSEEGMLKAAVTLNDVVVASCETIDTTAGEMVFIMSAPYKLQIT